jgi:hypothetical protein
MKALALMIVLVGLCNADFVEFGEDVTIINKPFCGFCYQNLRYQLLALDSDVSTAMTINSIFMKSAGGAGYVNLDELQIYIGSCSSDELSGVFDDNYITGSKTLVYDHQNVTLTAGGMYEWFEVPLDSPYFYDGQHNLIIDFMRTEGSAEINVWAWFPGENRSVTGGYYSDTGDPGTDMPHLGLGGVCDLNSDTFGAIKVLLGSPEDH